MLLNHCSAIFMEETDILGIVLIDVGYFTAITMCYFLVEGYFYTRSKVKYSTRLLVTAVISQIPYSLAFAEGDVFRSTNLNMLFTLWLCFLMLCVLDSPVSPAFTQAAVAALVFLTIFCDWAIFAAMFTLLFWWAKDAEEKKKKAFFWAVLSFGIFISLDKYLLMAEKGAVAGILSSLLFGAGAAAGPAAAGICLLHCYNKQRIKRGKRFFQWFFYLFYPVHLTILGILRIYWT